MKKIDLHIHTIKTVSDSIKGDEFEYSFDKLKEYVQQRNIDAISITNHNVFDLEQYKDIRDNIGIVVFPGIEIDLENGHILLITKDSDVIDFYKRCQRVHELIKTQDDTLSFEKFDEIFHEREKYLLIPHYKKNPKLKADIIQKVGNIYVGEVKNQREFEVLKKSKSPIVPAFFSDMRSVANLKNFPMRQTYVDVDEVTLESLKYALKDKSKVYLSANKNSLFELLPDGFQASTGLNVILGNRSSGKSVTLNKIENYNSNVKYIKQFALIEKDENNEEQIFSKKVKQKKSGVIEDYLKEFKEVLTDILSIDIKKYENDLVDYLQTWIEYAIDYDKRDSFAKAVLYTSGEIDYLDESDAIKVIDALIVLLSNNKYHNLIDKYLERDKIIELLKELLICYDNIRLKNTIAKETNLIVGMIKNKLTLQSNISAPKSFNFKEYYISRKKIEVFNELFNEIKKPRIVMNEKINKFTVVAETRGFSSATELKNSYGKKISFKAAMDQYNEGYKYILELKNIESIPETDFYRLIVYFDYKILNEYKLKVSGGERSEFRLLEELNDVSYYDMLLIDEPESSFDNMFLNQEVNERIKEISQKIPVFLVTHNNSIGESIKPDYYMYTKRCLKPDGKIEFKLYGGYPTAKELSTVDGDRIDNYSSLINSLEGGESVYNERCNDYEILKNR